MQSQSLDACNLASGRERSAARFADRFATIDSGDAFARQAQDFIEAGQLHSLNSRAVIGEMLEHLNVLTDFAIDFPTEEIFCEAEAAGRAGVTAFGVDEAGHCRALVVDWPEEHVKAPADHGFPFAVG